MDLEGKCSAIESVEGSEVVSQGTVSHVNYDNIKNNGSRSAETRKLGNAENHDINAVPVDKHENDVQDEQKFSPSLAMQSPAGGSPTTKGHGLKKWRRIKRDFIKDAGPSVDSSKILKRGLSGSTHPTKPVHLSSFENRQDSEGSIGSVNVVNNVGVINGFATHGSGLVSRFAVGSAFAAGTDAENSEDQSSKSSTAASAPKLRYELPAASGYARERNRIKNLNGKSGGNPTPRVQQGKSPAESSKKPRGEKVKIEKKNSHSTMESDLRSSNLVFMQSAFSVTSNGRQSGPSMNYAGENINDANGREQFNEEVQTSYTKENVEEVKDLSQDDSAADLSWNAKEEKSENHRPSKDHDPLVESLLTLQSVHEALKKGVQKFGVLGTDVVLLHDCSFNRSSIPAISTFTNPEIHGPSSPDKLSSEKIREGASSSLDIQVLSLMHNVKHLESKLEEARAMLEVKELKVSELEASLYSRKPLKEESGSTVELQPEQWRDRETELEGLFRQKIEAEIEYLALTMTIEKLRFASSDQITLTEEPETLVVEQARILDKLGEAENKTAVLKQQAEELEKYCGDILGTEVVLKMQKRVFKVTSCFILQFILLVLVFCLFVSELSTDSGVVVPT